MRACSITPASLPPRSTIKRARDDGCSGPRRCNRCCCRQSRRRSLAPSHIAASRSPALVLTRTSTPQPGVKNVMRRLSRFLPLALAGLLAAPAIAHASSHMDAPLITLDDAANTTDVYAFVHQENGVKVLVTALGVYPFEEPGIGPNKYNFDDDVLYEIHVATADDVA